MTAGHRRQLGLALLALGLLLPLADLWRWWTWRRGNEIGTYGERVDWSRENRGGVHFSGFVYRDRDRDGRLDLGDVPMASVVLELTRGDGKVRTERTNLSGYANFEMSRFERAGFVREPGSYELRALVPPGFSATSGNALQKGRIEALRGAPGDLVPHPPAAAIGLGPALSIAGRVLARDQAGALAAPPDARLRATDPAGATAPIRVEAGGEFSFPATPGPWRLLFELPASGVRATREVVVRDAPVRLATVVPGDASREPLGEPFTVDFESITGRDMEKIPAGVAGLDWDMLNAIEVFFAAGEGYANTLVSGHYLAYNSSGNPATIARPGGFDFHGAYLGISRLRAEGEVLRLQAFRDGVLVAEDEVRLSAMGPVWFDADWRGVDRVTLATRHSWQFGIDDLVAAVPSAPP